MSDKSERTTSQSLFVHLATGETDLQGKKLEVVAPNEMFLRVRAREEIAGQFLSAWKYARKLERLLLWWKEESGAPAVDLREIRRLTAESNVK